MSSNALEGTLIITDLKRNSLGRTEISEYTTPPMNALVTALPGLVPIFCFGRWSERLSRRLVILKNFLILFPTKINFLLYLTVMMYMRLLAQVVAKHISA